MRFEVEAVLDTKRPIVLVRSLEGTAFEVSDKTELHGCRVKLFDMPRAVDENGKPRMDVFGFVLEKREDLARFSAGQRVELKSR